MTQQELTAVASKVIGLIGNGENRRAVNLILSKCNTALHAAYVMSVVVNGLRKPYADSLHHEIGERIL